MGFLEFEDKLKNWIEDHKVSWCFILFAVGLSLGLLSNFLLEGNLTRGSMMGFLFGVFALLGYILANDFVGFLLAQVMVSTSFALFWNATQI